MKNIVKFLKDRRGVSPVIGVILMVAITVILSAVVAAFAYGYVGETVKSPNVVLSVRDNPSDNSSILIRQSAGESILANDWRVSITTGSDNATDFDYQAQTGSVAISPGTTLVVTKDTTNAGSPVSITTGWYHVVAVHVDSDTTLLDTNVQVR